MQARWLRQDAGGRAVYWQAREALGQMVDPKTATDIVELGWVASVAARDGRVEIRLVPPRREQPRLRELVSREVGEAIDDGWEVDVRHLTPVGRWLQCGDRAARRAIAWMRRPASRMGAG